MKYVHLENNKILGYYSKDINPNIPKGCLEITNEQWQEALSINANCYENGKFIVKDWRTAEEINGARIQEIESRCNQEIEAIYPIYKQINITNLLTPYTEDDRDVMKAFIDSKRAICHKALDDGANPEEINWEITNG